MAISADIQWIKQELDKVEDPYLIEVFKSLLKYREHSALKEMDAMILEAEEAYDQGKVISHEALKAEMKTWRA